jgi:eukaryotic-like serine/threonine-protein kinase
MKGIEGSTLGRYELHHRIARGGMSEVYLGYDRRVKRRVAVKVLYGSDEAFVRRFEREALAVGALTHDHILPLYDFGEQRPWYYLVMPFVEGGTLRDYLLKRERLTLEEAGSFLEQIAFALQYAHDHDVVHRDVKPSNILLRPDGHAYLGDFGLAKAKMEAESLTHSGSMIGTPEYMAPEQSDGINDYRSDIYSLGIILYQMLVGRVPFIADSPVAVTLRHIQARPTPPRQLNSTIPLSIEEIMLKALAKNPDDRYQQARLFAREYRRALWQEHLRRQGAEKLLCLPQDYNAVQEHSHADVSVWPTDLLTSSPNRHEFTLLDAPTPLFPLQSSAFSFPSLPYLHRKKKHFFSLALILTSLLFLGTLIPLTLVKQHEQKVNVARLQARQTQMIQQAATGTTRTHMHAQATLAAQAHVQSSAGITAAIGAGKVLYASDLTSPEVGWLNDGYQCAFASHGYHVFTPAHGAAWCYFNQRSFSTTVMTVQATLLRGDVYGLIFRLNPFSKSFYVLELNSRGEFRFVRAHGRNPLNWLTLIDWTRSDAIHKGYGIPNVLLVVANQDHFSFYINRQLVISMFQDDLYATGFIGFLVAGDNLWGTRAVFNNVWIFQK